MATIRVSAPAKVLLFGEHAVVYGCPAIAASLSDLRITVAVVRERLRLRSYGLEQMD